MRALDIVTARRALRAGFPLVNDHPDVAGVLARPELLALLGPTLALPFVAADVTVVCAPEARGPVIGALVAVELGAGLVIVRKADRNHPGADVEVTSAPTWRGSAEVFQSRSWDLTPEDRVLVVDDWVTTGSSIRAMKQLVELSGATYVGASVLVDKADFDTIDELAVVAAVPFVDLVSDTGSTGTP